MHIELKYAIYFTCFTILSFLGDIHSHFSLFCSKYANTTKPKINYHPMYTRQSKCLVWKPQNHAYFNVRLGKTMKAIFSKGVYEIPWQSYRSKILWKNYIFFIFFFGFCLWTFKFKWLGKVCSPSHLPDALSTTGISICICVMFMYVWTHMWDRIQYVPFQNRNHSLCFAVFSYN